VKREIKKLWPYSKIRLFGSSPLNLNLDSGDIDISVFISADKKENEMKNILTLQTHLEKYLWVKSVQAIKA
jgi:DNA polymerase sigma